MKKSSTKWTNLLVWHSDYQINTSRFPWLQVNTSYRLCLLCTPRTPTLQNLTSKYKIANKNIRIISLTVAPVNFATAGR